MQFLQIMTGFVENFGLRSIIHLRLMFYRLSVALTQHIKIASVGELIQLLFVNYSDTLTDVSSLQDVDDDDLNHSFVDEDDDNDGPEKDELGDLTIPDFTVSFYLSLHALHEPL